MLDISSDILGPDVNFADLIPLADGLTERKFEYRSHAGSEKAKYRLIYDINQSMRRVRDRCTTDSRLLREHRCGDTIRKPALNEAQLCRVPVTDWDSMADVNRVKLWGTGTDLFILGKEVGPRTTDIRAQVARNNAMGTPFQMSHVLILRTGTVQGVRVVPDDDENAILNALDLPGGHFIHPNPLLGTGFDLENVAYFQTNGLPGLETKYPKYEEMYWKLLALTHALLPFHFDICVTWLYNSGLGEKLRMRGRPRTTDTSQADSKSRDIPDTKAFQNWQPDRASIQDCDYEVLVIPAGAGILLQQPGREHAVISSNTGSDSNDCSRTATWVVGGYCFCASSIRPAMSVTLHMVIAQHLLTNADHFPMWPIFIRVNMFWLNVTADLRRYNGTGTPEDELSEAKFTSTQYASWRKWIASKYKCCDASHDKLDWERDIFSPSLLHLSLALYHYHRRQSAKDHEIEIFQTFTSKVFASAISDALRRYDPKASKQFQKDIDASESLGSTNFFLFENQEMYIEAQYAVVR
ncbi:hypothetical protein B0H14DRAFT_2585657 [Mycena olivaceomarginata]|nr:hypothetical protein B0H14DRAFT_2585657 [Mycena olivaceomarginata]